VTLGPAPRQADLFRSTAAYCEGRVAPDSIYGILHRKCFRLFLDEMFADLFDGWGAGLRLPGVRAHGADGYAGGPRAEESTGSGGIALNQLEHACHRQGARWNPLGHSLDRQSDIHESRTRSPGLRGPVRNALTSRHRPLRLRVARGCPPNRRVRRAAVPLA
jgi:hypothetical protein